MDETGPVTYREFSIGEKTFRVPNSGYYFNNTDCWARIDGTVAKVGISDFSVLTPGGSFLFYRPTSV